MRVGMLSQQPLAGGLADVPYAPSPFTRVGPGLNDAPVPDFSDHGGNTNAAYAPANGLGVFGLSSTGLWEDRSGTSNAAPILSRECAKALTILQSICPPGSARAP